jgi:multidrug efflux pump subunit AcrB
MYVLGFGLDMLTMLALIISIGFVVDDAIIVIENTARLIDLGLTPVRAAIRSARELTTTIISITLSLLVAFMPMLFQGGIQGRFSRAFGLTIGVAIALSAVASLTLTPMMCARFLKASPPPRAGSWGAGWDRGLAALIEAYERSLAIVLVRWRLMVALMIGMIVATVLLFIAVPKALFPTEETNALRGATEVSPDSSFASLSARQDRVVAVLLADPAIADVTSQIGSSFFGAPPTAGQLNINLKPMAVRRLTASQVIDRLRPALAKVQGIDTYLSPVQDFMFGARSSKAQYQYTLTGPDSTTLNTWVGIVRARFQALPQLADVGTDAVDGGLQVDLAIDRDAAARLGVTAAAIDQTLYDAFGQRQVATVYTELDQFKVVLEVDPRLQTDPSAFDHLYVASTSGAQVPLSAVARRTEDTAPTEVNHQGSLPAVTITFNVAPGVPIDRAFAAIRSAVKALHLPDGINADFAGDALATQQSNSDTPVLLLSAIFGVYVVLGMLYESYAHPLTILSTIPSAGIGAILALFATHTPLSQFAIMGFILLTGLVMKNAILLVDYALRAQRQGMSADAAIIQACARRFRPIIMTTLAATLGALPVAIGWGTGSELRQPVAIVIIGGVLVNQLLSLYTTPAIFIAIDKLRARRRRGQGRAVAEAG